MKKMTKKFFAALLAAVMLCGMLVSCEGTGTPAETGTGTAVQTEGEKPAVDYDPARTLFVSTDGDDAADGTWEHPLASLDGARKAVKKILEAGEGGVTVYFRGGNYILPGTVSFDETDSGTSADEPVVYKAYNGEEVILNAGMKISPEKITSAADSWVASRMRDPEQAKKLLVIELGKTVLQLPGLRCRSYVWMGPGKNPFGRAPEYLLSPELFMGDTPAVRARWPEDGELIEFPNNWTENDDPMAFDSNCKSRNVYLSEEILDRAAGWSDESLESIYMMGLLYANCYYEAYKLEEFNRDGGYMKLRSILDQWEMETGRAYFMNIPEELDVPGESYLEEKTGKFYFLPTEDYDPENVWYSGLENGIVNLDGTKNITFEGISFKYSKASAITGTGLSDFVMRDCTVLHTSDYGVYLDGEGILLSGCEIGDTNNSCVYVSGGDDKTLTSGRCVIENCVIHSCGRNKSNFGYEDLITTHSTGTVIRNCELYDCPSVGIKPYANQLLVEYCDFHAIQRYTGDFGAIYWNSIGHNFGNVIRYNVFHDVGNEHGFGHEGIYHDGVGIGGEIYGNLFYDFHTREDEGAEGVIKLGQAQFASIYNNIFVDVGIGIWNANLSDPAIQSVLESMIPYSFDSESQYKKLYDAGFDSDIWREAFVGKHPNGNLYNYLKPGVLEELLTITDPKDISKYLREHPELVPKNENICENNLFIAMRETVNGSDMMRDDAKKNYYDAKGADTSIFADYENDNFALTAEGLAKVRETIPDFEELPLDKMGRNKNNG